MMRMLVLFTSLVGALSGVVVYQTIPNPCDIVAAQQCEYDQLLCQLFTGPANDPATMCRCASTFYGECLRLAGVLFWFSFFVLFLLMTWLLLFSSVWNPSTSRCIDSTSDLHENMHRFDHSIWLSQFADMFDELRLRHFNWSTDNQDHSIQQLWTVLPSHSNLSKQSSQPTVVQVKDFFIWVSHQLSSILFCTLIHTCTHTLRYSFVNTKACQTLTDFSSCSRWIPPLSFVPVALPVDTTYIEVDSCEYLPSGQAFCHTASPAPVRMYGNKFLFPTSFDVPQSNVSVCSSDGGWVGWCCGSNVALSAVELFMFVLHF